MSISLIPVPTKNVLTLFDHHTGSSSNKEPDRESDNENATPPSTRSKKKKDAPSATKPKQKPSKPNMSSNKSDKDSDKNTAFISEADADVTEGSGPQEGVFLSNSYRTEKVIDGQIVACKNWVIVVFAYSKQDAKNVDAQMIAPKGSNAHTVCRIKKNKFPWLFKNEKLITFCQMVFGQYETPAKAFSGSIIKNRQLVDNDIYIDVHFPEPVVNRARRLCEKNLKIYRNGSVKCRDCGLKDILEKPNVVVFEIEALESAIEAELTTRAEEAEGYVSE